MRNRQSIVLVAVVALTALVRGQPAGEKPVLVKAARILDVRAGTYRSHQGVWVDAGRIRQVGNFDEVRAATPKDIAVIDLGGAALLPGLIDCHAHLLSAMDPEVDPSDNLILTLARESPARRALLGASTAREMLEGGFTTVRNVGHSGVDGDIALRDAIRRGLLRGPRIVAAARKIAPYGGQAIASLTAAGQTLVDQDFLIASSPAEGRRGVLENLRLGADMIKVVADDGSRVIDEETMKAIVDEAHRAGMRVAVHATTTRGIQAAIIAGADSIEHGDEVTGEQLEQMRAKRIVYVPTLWPAELLPISRALARRPDIDKLKAAYVTGERTKLDRARTARVAVAFGSDMWFGYRGQTRAQMTRRLLESLQPSFGMTPAEVLRSATISAAELVNLPNVSGAIEAGTLADLIAVNGDPLTDVAELEKLAFVMQGGIVVRHDR